MGKWGFWDWVGYSGIFTAATMLAYEAALNSSPHIAANLPSLSANWFGVLPLTLLILSGIVFLLQKSNVLPHGRGGQKPIAEVYPFAWKGPNSPLVPVVGKKFLNQKVLLDGHAYAHCTFENVTFVYNGTAIFQFSDNTITGSMMFNSTNPAVQTTFLLLHGLGMLPEGFQLDPGPGIHVEPGTFRRDTKAPDKNA